MADPVTIGTVAVSALSIAAEALAKGALGEAGKNLYSQLRGKVVSWAVGRLSPAERIPIAAENQRAVAERIDEQPADELAEIRRLLAALLEKLEQEKSLGPIGIDAERLEAARIHLRQIEVTEGIGVRLRDTKTPGEFCVEGLQVGAKPGISPAAGEPSQSAVAIGVQFAGSAMIGTFNYGLDAKTAAKLDSLIETLQQSDQRRALARRLLVAVVAAVFVDQMRMLYVGASDLAKRSNAPRYPEFVQMAEQHLHDFHSLFQRHAADLDAEFISAARKVEQRCLWMFARLKSGPCRPIDGTRYFREAAIAAEQLSDLCGSAHIAGWTSIIKMTAEIGKSTEHELNKSGPTGRFDYLFRARLHIQSVMLQRLQDGENLPVLRIADDMHQDFSLPYFLIDHFLLRHYLSYVG
jgi:hypothetical protein